MNRPVILVVMLLLPVTALYSQTEPLTWKAELRLRSEADMRDFRNSTPANLYSLLRARLGALLQPRKDVRVFLQLQDSRVFGSERAAGSFSTLANTANLDLHQGYLELDDFPADGMTLQAGRMEVSLGTQRLIGAVGWNNVGRSFDGIRLSSTRSFGVIDVFALNTGESTAAPSSATPSSVTYVREAGQFLGGTYVTLSEFSPFALDLFAFYELNTSQSIPGTNDLSRVTAGGYGRGASGSVWYQAEMAYQLGKVRNLDLGAYLVAVMTGLDLSSTGLQRVGIGADLLSGTPSTATTESKTFVPAFHTGHKFYGLMDYFVGIPAQGLHDFIATARFASGDGITVETTGHLFRLAESSPQGKDLGAEIDVIASWKYNPYTLLQAGFTAFLPGDVMKALYGSTDAAFWGFVTIQVSI